MNCGEIVLPHSVRRIVPGTLSLDFPRPDIHAAIHLPAVGGYDLAVPFLATSSTASADLPDEVGTKDDEDFWWSKVDIFKM